MPAVETPLQRYFRPREIALEWGLGWLRFFAAVVHSVEEAVVNALVVNTEMVGRDGHRSPALPHDRVVEAMRRAYAT